MPIMWFGDREAFEKSPLRVVTVSLNPSDKEFMRTKGDQPSTSIRFPDFNGTDESMVMAYNNYFKNGTSYDSWFKSSFGAVLESFDASFYPNQANNTALHTDFCSPWATNPTWGRLPKDVRNELFSAGVPQWHALMEELGPDIILFSASPDLEQHIRFQSASNNWKLVDVGAKRPLMIRQFHVGGKLATVLFQVQGRRPFLQTARDAKLKFSNHLK